MKWFRCCPSPCSYRYTNTKYYYGSQATPLRHPKDTVAETMVPGGFLFCFFIIIIYLFVFLWAPAVGFSTTEVFTAAPGGLPDV